MQPILSRENQKIKYASKLKNRKFRNSEHSFLIEGTKILEEALKCPEIIVRIFVDQTKVEEYQELSEKHKSLEWYSVDTKLIEYISDAKTPQGIVAIARQPRCLWDELIADSNLFILLDQISDPGNMGTIIRTAWAFGVDGILLTHKCVDPFSPKAVRSSMGGIFNVPIFSSFGRQNIESLKEAGFSLMCSDLNTNNNYYSLDFNGKIVIVIGSEAHGVSNHIKTQCDIFFRIPTNPQVDSLNAAVASAIILNEAWKQKMDSSLFQ
ncbi:MAG: RNA methyltransferase [Syntrophomonadaceae bacterium]|nr:RNA methyltransferase [Syntrophomonadaceae bacterium]